MPKKVFVDVDFTLPKQLEKDLNEGEAICPTCRGMGIYKTDIPFGLHGEKHPSGKMFPYKKEFFVPCPTCYTGVVKVCKYCGLPGRKGYIHPELNCSCEGAKKAREQEYFKKISDRWEKAKKITLEEAIQQFPLVYIEEAEEYISPGDFQDWLENKKADDPDYNVTRIYATTIRELVLDAEDIVSSECENQELHEEAYQRISDDRIKELQKLLDSWLEKVNGDTTTYYPDFSIGIITNA